MNANNSGVQPSASILTRLASKSSQYTACSYVRQKSMVGIVFRAPLFPISDALLQCRPALSIHARSIDAVLRNLLPSTYCGPYVSTVADGAEIDAVSYGAELGGTSTPSQFDGKYLSAMRRITLPP